MKHKRVNIYAQHLRKMTKDKKDKRRERVRGARKRKREEETEAFYLNCSQDARRCEKFVKSACHKGTGRGMIHSEVDREKYHIDMRREKVEKDMSRVKLTPNPEFKGELNSVGGEAGADDWTHIVANFDTGAAVPAIPSVLKEKLGSETSARSYKTASGELLADEGATVLNGYDNDGLASSSAAGKKNCVTLDGASGAIAPNDGPIADGRRRSLRQLTKKHPKDARRLTSMYQQGGIYTALISGFSVATIARPPMPTILDQWTVLSRVSLGRRRSRKPA